LLILDKKTAAILTDRKQADVVCVTSLYTCQNISKEEPTLVWQETLFCAEVHRGRSLHSMQRKAFSLQRFS